MLHIHHTYANAMSNPTNTLSSPAHLLYDPDQPNNVHHMTNQLHIAEKQVYITFNQSDPKAPKDKSGQATHQMCTKLNSLLKSLKPPPPPHSPSATTSTPSGSTSILPICALRSTKCSTILLEFESPESPHRFHTLNENTICSPHTSVPPHLHNLRPIR